MNFIAMTLTCNACEKDDSVECRDACKDGVCVVANHAKLTPPAHIENEQ